ncbi:MAG: hypothetical protein LAT68_07315 [Cyclobacteriaceae bacterium]|nr:hypothetical protein [Cyclobacteriaceae bacterium]MCH8516124.1 hypothetical protein [Cyclobacteriaceae bacterium]
MLNPEGLSAYSRALAKILCDRFYSDATVAHGDDLLHFCDVKQINYMIIKRLFDKWQRELEKLKSPYFNYNHPKVKDALEHFMNVLSQNIQVKRQDLKDLVVEACSDTLLLTEEPFRYYRKEINSTERSRLSVQRLRMLKKYIHINTSVLDELIAHFERNKVSEVFNDEAYDILLEVEDKIQLSTADTEAQLLAFDSLLPRASFHLYQVETDVNQVATSDQIDQSLNEPKANKPPESSKKPAPINEKLSSGKQMLHDKLSKGKSSKPDLAAKEQSRRTQNLHTSVSINQRFMFVKELFGGDQALFTSTLDKLEKAESLHEARDYVVTHFDWDIEKEEVAEFFELLERRFS